MSAGTSSAPTTAPQPQARTTPRVPPFAIHRISVHWIINLVDRQLEVYSDPDPRSNPPAYRRRETYLPGQAIPLVLKSQVVAQIPAGDMLP
jgi:hypothetical protein